MVPVGSSASLSAKAAAAPTVLKVDEENTPQQAEISPIESSSEEDTTTTVKPEAPSSDSSPTTKKTRRTSKMTRFTELEPIHSNTIMTTEEKEMKRATATVTALPTDFDESALPQPKEIVLPTSPAAPLPPSPSKSGKLTKGAAGGKLVKKNRWSLRSSKSTAVAV
jgi:hypothetical protein